MIKTSKQLAKYIIPRYKKVIKDGRKDSFKRFRIRIYKNDMQHGICHFLKASDITIATSVKHNLWQDIGHRLQYHAHISYGYWAPLPAYAKSKRELVDCLQRRIDLLKEHCL